MHYYSESTASYCSLVRIKQTVPACRQDEDELDMSLYSTHKFIKVEMLKVTAKSLCALLTWIQILSYREKSS